MGTCRLRQATRRNIRVYRHEDWLCCLKRKIIIVFLLGKFDFLSFTLTG